MTPEKEREFFEHINYILLGSIDVSPEAIMNLKVEKKVPESVDKALNYLIYAPDNIYQLSNNHKLLSNYISSYKNLNEFFSDDENINTRPFSKYKNSMHMGIDIAVFSGLYKKEKIINGFEKNLNYWKSIAKENNVDISHIVENIETQSNRLNKIEEFEQLCKSINELNNTISTMDFVFELNNFSNTEQLLKLRKEIKELLNSPDYILNQPQYKDVQSTYDYFEINDILKEINNQVNSICTYIIEKSPEFSSVTNAYQYKELNNDSNKLSDIVNFIESKNNIDLANDSILYEYTVPNSSHYNSFIIFKDGSIIVKDKENNITIPRDNTEAQPHILRILGSHIDFKLKKNPTLNKFFKTKLSENYNELNACIITIERFLQNEQILKSSKFNILKYKDKRFEFIDDEINKSILAHKVKKYAHSIASNKYMNLYNEETYKLCKQLYDYNIDEKLLQDTIGKKIAAYKTPQDFNEALIKFCNNFNDFTPEATIEKANLKNAKIIINEDDLLILEINNFEQSKVLGSTSWCISRDNHYFNSYTEDNAKQYFIYDFTKDVKDNHSLIGLTLYKEGNISTSHLKNDSQCTDKHLLELYQLNILKSSKDDYPSLKKDIEKRLTTNNISLKEISLKETEVKVKSLSI